MPHFTIYYEKGNSWGECRIDLEDPVFQNFLDFSNADNSATIGQVYKKIKPKLQHYHEDNIIGELPKDLVNITDNEEYEVTFNVVNEDSITLKKGSSQTLFRELVQKSVKNNDKTLQLIQSGKNGFVLRIIGK